MKNFLSSILFAGTTLFVFTLLLMVPQSAPATGAVGADPIQTGTLNFTALTSTGQTNSFPFTFTTTPVIVFNAITTNSTPITNLMVTTTNFGVSVATTNSTINWTAFVGYARIETGTNAVQSLQVITNTFPTPFAAPPVVTICIGATNALSGITCVTNTTTTNFVVQYGNTNGILQWTAVGVGFSPGSYNPNYPQVTY